MSKIQVLKVHTLTGHRDSVYALEGVSDLQFISAAGDGMVVLWDLGNPTDGRLIAKLDNSIYAIHQEATHGHLLVGHNYDGMHVIDWEEKRELGSLKFTKSAIYSISSHEGIAFVGTEDGELVVIDIANLKIVNRVKLSHERVRTIAVNPIRSEIAIGCSDATIKILDLRSYKVKQELRLHSKSVFKLQYNKDYSLLISTGRDAHMIIWTVQDKYELLQDIVAHMYTINDIVYNPTYTLYATCSMDKSIKVWDAKSHRLLKVIDKARHAGHGTSVNRLWWGNTEGLLVSASDDRTIAVWEIGLV